MDEDIILEKEGEIVKEELSEVRKGGRVVWGGINMRDIK